MKHQSQIIGVVALCVVFGAIGAVYQFYYKDIFAQYRNDDALRDTLERSLAQLQETFQGYKPDLLVDEWQRQVEPWRNAREERSAYFNFGDWFEVEVQPEETQMLRFWYTERSDAMTMALYTKVYEKMGGYDRFPQDIRAVFNIQGGSDFAGAEISMDDVRINLQYLQFATSLTEFLLDANIVAVDNIVHWPRRIPALFEQLLALQTVGLRFRITARDLVRMLDNIRQEPRYFTVDAISINYPYIGYGTEPLLNVSMLLTQGNYRRPTEQPERPVQSFGDPDMSQAAARPTSVTTTAEEGIGTRVWRWFKRYVLYTN